MKPNPPGYSLSSPPCDEVSQVATTSGSGLPQGPGVGVLPNCLTRRVPLPWAGFFPTGLSPVAWWFPTSHPGRHSWLAVLAVLLSGRLRCIFTVWTVAAWPPRPDQCRM